MEILAGNLDELLRRSGISAVKTFESKDRRYQVWEIEKAEFDKLGQTKEKDYQSGEWWRYGEGSNMGPVFRRYKINHRYIKAWDGDSRIETEKENLSLPVIDRLTFPREYAGLAEYLCDELGASQPRNVCALCVDLAKQNDISMADLFKRFYEES